MPKLIPPRRGELLTKDGIGTLRFLDYLEGTAAEVNNNTDNNTDNQTELEDNTGVVLTRRDFLRSVSVQSADYTTSESELVICTDKITVTLNSKPDDQELVSIQASNGVVIVDANGNTINGETDAVIRRNYTTWDLIFLVEIKGWIII